MLPRRQRSIFHLGEEGGDDRRGAEEHVKSRDESSTRRLGGSRNQQGRRRREPDAADAVVGLRILVAQHPACQHARAAASRSHIVLKQMVLPRRDCGFLRACFLCRRELRPDKDVYMYRGDQGFCSQECRWQQILRDEAREREFRIKNQRLVMSSLQHHYGPRSAAAPAPAVRGAPRRLLAVA